MPVLLLLNDEFYKDPLGEVLALAQSRGARARAVALGQGQGATAQQAIA